MGSSLQDAITAKFVKLLKSKDPEKAARIIKKEYFATGPDKEDLEKSVSDFSKKYGYILKSSDSSVRNRRMKFAESRFDAMMEAAKEGAMREVLMDKLIAKQLKSAKVKLQKNQKVEKFSCLYDLMHLENTPEARLHNEKVVSLMLLNQGLISPEKYKTLRTNQLRKENRADNMLVEEEAADPKKSFLDLIRQEVAALQKNAKYAEQGALDIMDSKQNDPEKLRKAFHAIADSRRDILTKGHNLYEMDTYDWKRSATEDEKKWVEENLLNYGTGNADRYCQIYGLANPYFSIIEPEEMLEYRILNPKNKIGNPKDENFDALNQYFVDTGIASVDKHQLQKMDNEEKFEEKLKKLGMQGAQKSDYLNGFTVYKKDKDVVITKSEVRSLAPFTEKMRMTKHSELLCNNLTYELRDFMEQCQERNTGRSSPSYQAMELSISNALVSGIAFRDEASHAEINEFKKSLVNLQKTADAYLKHKEADFRKRRIPQPVGGYKNHSRLAKNSYERKRIELAESILKFTKNKLEVINLTNQYRETLSKSSLHNAKNPQNTAMMDSKKKRININMAKSGKKMSNFAMREPDKWDDNQITTDGKNKSNPAMREPEDDVIYTGMRESDDLGPTEKNKSLTNFINLSNQQKKERGLLTGGLGKHTEKKDHNNNNIINNDNIINTNSYVKGH